MMLIPCPHCGPRALAEFTFDRPVEAISRPDEPAEAVIDKLFTRENPRGPSRELWRHTYGCRAWLTLTRDTASHLISDVEAVAGALS